MIHTWRAQIYDVIEEGKTRANLKALIMRVAEQRLSNGSTSPAPQNHRSGDVQ
jgi:hypothetical protein